MSVLVMMQTARERGVGMRYRGLFLIAMLLIAGVADAAVVIEIHDQPLMVSLPEGRDDARAGGDLFDAESKANRPAQGQWFIPYFKADRLHDGESTYFAIRNEEGLPTSVLVEFFDVAFELQTTQTYDLESREVKTVAVKHVPNLPIDLDGYARGFLRMTASRAVSVDYFQMDTENAFAVGGNGFILDDFCTRWSARFLRFSEEGGTVVTMMVNGPQGTLPSDLATVVANVYSEAGVFVSSFEIRTDEYALEIAIHDLLPPDVDFGVVELIVNSVYTPSGIVEVQHQALGQFSVGHWAVCTD